MQMSKLVVQFKINIVVSIDAKVLLQHLCEVSQLQVKFRFQFNFASKQLLLHLGHVGNVCTKNLC